jgi:hypothetical protein
MRVRRQLHVPTPLTTGKQPQVPNGQEGEWGPGAGPDAMVKRKNSFTALAGAQSLYRLIYTGYYEIYT